MRKGHFGRGKDGQRARPRTRWFAAAPTPRERDKANARRPYGIWKSTRHLIIRVYMCATLGMRSLGISTRRAIKRRSPPGGRTSTRFFRSSTCVLSLERWPLLTLLSEGTYNKNKRDGFRCSSRCRRHPHHRFWGEERREHPRHCF